VHALLDQHSSEIKFLKTDVTDGGGLLSIDDEPRADENFTRGHCEAWIEALVPVLDAKYLGVRRAGLVQFLAENPSITGHTVAEVCGMVHDGHVAETCPWTGRSMLPGLVVARTADTKCCFVDLWRGALDHRNMIGLMDTFVSHAWHEGIDSLLEGADLYLGELEARLPAGAPRPALWIDIFCKNQWVVNSDDTEAELASCVARARSSYDLGPPTLLLVLSPFPTPTLFTRVWWVDLAT
jgi:hypothetical protein